MKHLAAAVLLHLAGKPVDEKGIKSVIEASGAKSDDAKVKKLVDKLKGKDVLKFAKENSGKVAVGGAAPAEAKKEEKKEEKKDAKKDEKKPDPKKAPPKKEEPEDEDEGLGGLF